MSRVLSCVLCRGRRVGLIATMLNDDRLMMVNDNNIGVSECDKFIKTIMVFGDGGHSTSSTTRKEPESVECALCVSKFT